MDIATCFKGGLLLTEVMDTLSYTDALADSGIDLDLMTYINAEEDPANEQSHYYELKSKVVVGSPVTEIKNASLPMRANLKQQLQRQQLLEQEKRDLDTHTLAKSNGHPSAHHIQGSNSITVPRVVDSAEVPVNVLQVKTQLQHPTKYHVRQSQKRQVQHFLNESSGSHLPIQSLPANTVSSAQEQTQQYHIQSSSSAPDPDLTSPLMGPSAEFISSDFDLLSDLQSVEPLELGILSDTDLVEIQPSLGASSNGSLLTWGEGVEDNSGQAPASCPTPVFTHQDLGHTGMMSVQDELWRKERIKKDNHNMIERRRRFNINDRIKELGGLLPRHLDPEVKQNKGNILKASVDYIKSLQDDQRKLAHLQEQKKKQESDMRKLLITLNQYSSIIKSHGIQTPHLEPSDIVSKLSVDFLTPPSTLSPTLTSLVTTAPTSTQTSYSMTHMDELMDETSPVSGDPMLLSTPVSPEADDHFFHS